MQRNQLAGSQLLVSQLCLGSMTWGEQNTKVEAFEQLNYAMEHGINFIDTAEMYPIPMLDGQAQGATEEYIGQWFTQASVSRSDIVLASKVSPTSLISTRPTGAAALLTKESVYEAVAGSLQRLQTDYIDLYYVHWPERSTNFFGQRGYVHVSDDVSTPIVETLTALKEMQDKGHIRYVGISNETPWGMSEYVRLAREHDLPKLIAVQNQYSLTNREYEVGMAEIAMREDIALIPYSVLNMGSLTGKYLHGSKPQEGRLKKYDFKQIQDRYNSTEAQPAIAAFVDVAKRHGLDPTQMAIAFVVSRPFVSSTIIGATKMNQLTTCIDAAQLDLPSAVLKDIEAVYAQYPNSTC